MRRVVFVVLALAAFVFGTASAHAGGWAIGSLDETALTLRAGEPTDVGYTVLQHGKTPIALEESGIRARSLATGEVFTFPGTPGEPLGHHVATVGLPSAGEWALELDLAMFGPQAAGTVTVSGAEMTPLAATPVVTSSPDVPAWRRIGLPMLAGIAIAVFAAQLFAVRRRREPASVSP